MANPADNQLLSAPNRHRYTTFVMILVIFAGLAGSVFAAFNADYYERALLKSRALNIAGSLSPKEIRALSGTKTDLNNQVYQDLKRQINSIRTRNQDVSLVYILGFHGNKIINLINSEKPNSVGYAAPGQIIKDPSYRLTHIRYSQESLVEGPTRDSKGLWFSGLAPITDLNSGEIIGVVRIVTSAYTHYLVVASFALVPIILASIPLLGLIRDRKLESKEREIIQLKTQFVSVASHELRSPLNGMIWAIESLLKPEVKNLTIEQQSVLLDMYQSAEASISTINEILDLTIFERGKQSQLAQEVVELSSVVKSADKALHLSAHERNISVKFEGDWERPFYTTGDVNALKRVYMNLIANAIKYSHDDGTINLRHIRHDRDHIITIEDRGIGIPASEQPKVLSGYYRAANARASQTQGTGLGLFLAKMVVQQHRGRLWIKSRENHGTTVYTSLPALIDPKKKEQ